MGGGRNRGGQKRGRTQRRHFRDGRENVWKKPRPEGAPTHDADDPSSGAGGGWDPFVTQNPNFENYYKQQGIVSENEWDDFLATLRRPLPAVFRINGSGQFAKEIGNQIQHEFVDMLKNDCEGDELIKPLPWYPGKLAWHLNFSRMQLRKNQTLARIHEFLKRENIIGSITRQEAVSMVPPLFLDVQPHHRVLDMCAAPGSKTFQLLEMIHSTDKKDLLPDGLVVANDLDVQRCHLLIHQTKRMCSPNVIVTNHEAQHFPGLRKDKERASEPSKDGVESSIESDHVVNIEEERGLLFDRVLCDVPCSGDGTIRKAPDLWKKWNAGIGNGLHRLQVQIAMRGVALLKVGGRMVYSTCSLNPIENEAVVGEILRRADGCLELLDVSSELPELRRRPGLKTWKVRDKGQWLRSYRYVNNHRTGSVVPGMFPLGQGSEEHSEHTDVVDSHPYLSEKLEEDETDLEILVNGEGGEVAILPLERCLRILPHDQDTGGFFVAVFRKVSVFKVEHTPKEISRNHRPAAKVSSTVESSMAAHKQVSVKDQLSETVGSGFVAVREEASEVPENSCNNSVTDTAPNEGLAMEKFSELEAPVSEDLHGDIVSVKESLDNKGTPDELETENMGLKVSDVKNQKHGRAQRQGNWKGVDPVLFLRDEALISSLINFYGIKESLPLHGHLVTRSEDITRLKRIYYVSQSVADVMKMNFKAGDQMKITSVGLKLFERQGGKEGSCAFRIASEGLPLLLPHVSKQIVHALKQDFKLLLAQRTVSFTAFSDVAFATAVEALLPGCCIVILKDENELKEENVASSMIAIGCWRGRSNVSLLIPKEDAGQLMERLFPGAEETEQPMNENDDVLQSEETIVEDKDDKTIVEDKDEEVQDES